MPQQHSFRKLVDDTGLLARAMEWQQRTGTEWPHPVDQAWRWSVRDVVAGQDVASGFAASYAEADAAAQSALETAEDTEAARLAEEQGLL